MSPDENANGRIGRRQAIRWIGSALATLTVLDRASFGVSRPARRYGSDPNLLEPGIYWSRTLSAEQLRTVSALSDLIIPADERSPSASKVGVPDFIDEWISAPYPEQEHDRTVVLEGLEWLDSDARRRFDRPFVELTVAQQSSIADDICYLPKAKPEFQVPARFFAQFRNLTAGGYYTTEAGMRDVGYVGNTPLPRFDGPPPEVLRHLGLMP